MVPLNRVIAGFVVLVAAVVGAFQLIPPSPEEHPLVTASDNALKMVRITPEPVDAPEASRAPSVGGAAVVEKAVVTAPQKTDNSGKARPDPRAGKGGKRGPKTPSRPKPASDEKNIIDNFGACGDDPMCGFDPSPRDEKKRR